MEEVPQINPATGLSYDYQNEFQSIVGYIEGYEKGVFGYKKVVDGASNIKAYIERFPSSKYSNVVHEKNEKEIRKLDIIVNSIKAVPKSTNVEEAAIQQLKSLIEEGAGVISGRERKIF